MHGRAFCLGFQLSSPHGTWLLVQTLPVLLQRRSEGRLTGYVAAVVLPPSRRVCRLLVYASDVAAVGVRTSNHRSTGMVMAIELSMHFGILSGTKEPSPDGSNRLLSTTK